MTQRIEFNEELVGNAHPTKSDTLNRFINLITAAGDILYGTAAATATKLSKGAAGALLGMNDADTAPEYKTLKVTTAGIATNAGQPAFVVKPNAAQENIALNVPVTIVFNTELFDAASNFAANTFTAPVAGKYQLNLILYLKQIDSGATNYRVSIVTTDYTYLVDVDPSKFSADVALWPVCMSVLAWMDAADTAYVAVTQTAGAQQTDIENVSYFSGFLAC